MHVRTQETCFAQLIFDLPHPPTPGTRPLWTIPHPWARRAKLILIMFDITEALLCICQQRDRCKSHLLRMKKVHRHDENTHIKGTLSWVDMRERPIQNLKKSAWCFQVEHSHFQYGVDKWTPDTAGKGVTRDGKQCMMAEGNSSKRGRKAINVFISEREFFLSLREWTLLRMSTRDSVPLTLVIIYKN